MVLVLEMGFNRLIMFLVVEYLFDKILIIDFKRHENKKFILSCILEKIMR